MFIFKVCFAIALFVVIFPTSAISGEINSTVKMPPSESKLKNMEKLNDSNAAREQKIKEILKNKSSHNLSSKELMKLQHELMQLQMQQEVTTKAADKSSQGVQTLLKNQ